ncbi:MAG: P22 phage major capsid protein family protein [Planctomycetota bacterium]
MANTLGNFNVPFYAAEALKILMNSIGTPRRVNRRFEGERQSFGKGEVVNIRRPSTFTVYDAPIAAGSVDDLATESVAITLDKYKETKFKVTDKELAFTSDAIIKQHIAPMAYAHANAIDAAIQAQAFKFPACQQITASSISDASVLTKADRILNENGVPTDRRHYAANPAVWEKWLGLTGFTNWQGAGPEGVDAQRNAALGIKYGFSPYPTNNGLSVAAQTSPTITAGAVNGAHAKGATSVALDGTAVSGTFKAGMVIQIGTAAATEGAAYNAQLYAVTADATAAGNAVTLSISPPLRAAVADNTTFTQKVNAAAAAFRTELAFHEDALALVMAPLPDRAMGADVQTVTDPNSGLSLRLRLFYDGNASAHYCAMDVLYGIQVLNADMAVRGIVV